MEKCGTCRFYISTLADTGDCRRHAPIAINETSERGPWKVRSCFAPTGAFDWCGDYERQQTAESPPPIKTTWDYV